MSAQQDAPAKGAPPKLRLRPAKLASRQPANHDAALSQLQNAITEIYHQRQSQLRFEECYRNAYNLVRANLATKLHNIVISTMGNNLKELGQTHLQPFYSSGGRSSDRSSPITILYSGPNSPSNMCDDVKPGLKNPSEPIEVDLFSNPEEHTNFEHVATDKPITPEEAETDARFIKALLTVWDRHLLSLPKIASILCYMDNHFIEHPHERCRPLMQDGPSQFYEKILLNDGGWAKRRLIRSALGQIEYERRGELVNRSLVKGVASMLLLLEEGAYEGLLEKPFLNDAAKFYDIEFSKLLETSSSADVLRKVGLKNF